MNLVAIDPQKNCLEYFGVMISDENVILFDDLS
jgi:hypothetical protein